MCQAHQLYKSARFKTEAAFGVLEISLLQRNHVMTTLEQLLVLVEVEQFPVKILFFGRLHSHVTALDATRFISKP